jgi:transcriptional regulator with XRE-family HTH domain
MRGDRLKTAREARELSQKDLGDRVGLSDKQIWRYENGLNAPGADALTDIAKALEVSLDYLVGLVDEPSGYFKDEGLSAAERRLIWAYRHGYIVEALKTLTAAFEETNQAHIAPNEPAVNG